MPHPETSELFVPIPTSLEGLHPLTPGRAAAGRALAPLAERRLYIWSALLAALEQRGHGLEPAPRDPAQVWCDISGVRLEIAIPDFFLVVRAGHRQGRWKCSGWPLERRLGKLVLRLEQLAVQVLQDQKDQEETDRLYQRALERRERRIRHRDHERECLTRLRAAAAGQEEARRLRRFAADVAREAKAMSEPPSNLDTWLAWAMNQADRLDPMVEGAACFLAAFADVGTDLVEEPLSGGDQEYDDFVADMEREGLFRF